MALTGPQENAVYARNANNPGSLQNPGNVCQRNLPGCTRTADLLEFWFPIEQLQQMARDIGCPDIHIVTCQNCAQGTGS